MSTDSTITVGSIGNWLHQGWRYYRQNALVSSTYIALFLLPGSVIQYAMVSEGYGLFYYLLAAGFIILIPALSALYYPLSSISDKGQQGNINDIMSGLTRVPKACWVLTAFMVAFYLIWITDAAIVYSFYFKLDPVLLSDYMANPDYRSEVNNFIVNISLAGMVLAAIAYGVTVLSLPHAFESQAGFVDAVVFSIKSITSHFRVMLLWALLLGISQLTALLIFSPLEIILLPILAYANLAAYRQISGVSYSE
ncbi:MAG: DUF2189 domain-containing protein [Candidatus Sedimenticola sp. (ex Thyasira tokunagai)]